MIIIDDFLNKITMYRLVLYYLITLIVVAVIFSLFGILPYSAVSIVASCLFTIAVALLANLIFARTYGAIPNVESAYITALILTLIINPDHSIATYAFLAMAATLAMASKYMIAWNHKHLFNPVAIAVAITAASTGQAASWWVGNTAMLPIVLIGTVLIIRKIRRFDMAASFTMAAVISVTIFAVMKGTSVIGALDKTVLYSPLFFFAGIMLTEPLTTPPTHTLQIIYGALIGALFAPQVHFASIYSTPELALLAGNVFSWIVSPKFRAMLTLQRQERVGSGIIDFVFKPTTAFTFMPGQYLEWTLATPQGDSRGNRRYFTIASSPTEKELRMGVKFYPQASKFKQQLQSLTPGQAISASSLAGSFTLPKDANQKCVFIAGGIGITPFRSMVKYLIDTNQKRDIVLLYSNSVAADIAYADVFEQGKAVGLTTIYTLTDATKIPAGWPGHVGMIDQAMITSIPDYQNRQFYLSGPHAMVQAFESLLKNLNIPRSHIKTDYFPGFV